MTGRRHNYIPKLVKVDITVPNQTDYLGMIGQIGENVAYSLKNYQGDQQELAYHLNMVLTEALTNAICHANCSDPDKEVRVLISASEQELVIKVFDHGDGFDIESLAKFKSTASDEGGRGIQIIFKLMDRVNYHQEGNRNVLEMIKYLQ